MYLIFCAWIIFMLVMNSAWDLLKIIAFIFLIGIYIWVFVLSSTKKKHGV